MRVICVDRLSRSQNRPSEAFFLVAKVEGELFQYWKYQDALAPGKDVRVMVYLGEKRDIMELPHIHSDPLE